MKFTVPSFHLRAAISFAMRAVKVSPIFPILENIYFSLSGSELLIRTTDMHTTLVTLCTADGEPDASAEFLIPAQKLSQLLSKLGEQPLTIVIDTEKYAHSIRWKTGKSTLTGENPADFPPIVKTSEPVVIELNHIQRDYLLQGFSDAVYACSKDELRPAMTGVFVHRTEKGLTLAATNGSMLVQAVLPIEIPDFQGVILPSSFIQSLLKTSAETDESLPLTLQLTPSTIEFRLAEKVLTSNLIDGRFPDYQQVIPTSHTKTLSVEKQEIINALGRTILTTNEKTKAIALVLSEAECTAIGENEVFAFDTRETLTATYTGEPLTIGFNGPSLLQILSKLHGETVRIEFTESNRAAVCFGEDDDIRTVLIPILINVHATV